MSTQKPENEQETSQRRSPGMREVAAHAGVALKTVSRVVNREPGVTAATVERVQASIEALGYTRKTHRPTRNRLVTHGAIGVVVQQLSEPFQARLAAAIVTDANERGYVALVSSSEAQPAREQAVVDSMEARGVAGMIVVPAPSGVDYQQSFASGRIPVVLADRPIPELKLDTVLADNVGGAHAGVRHLLERGHRRIALIGADPSFASARERFRGYRRALADFGVEPDPAIECLQWLRPNVVARVLDQLVQLPDPPTAIFSANGFYTVEIARELKRFESIAVVCFDDLPLSEAVLDGLTVVEQFPEEIAHTATDFLFRRIDGWDGDPQEVRIRTDLIIRSSSTTRPPAPLRLRHDRP